MTTMKKKKIETLAELREEKRLTRIRLRQKESDLLETFEEIKAELKPVRVAYKTVTGFFSHDNSIFGKTIGYTVDQIVRKGLLRNAGFITRFAVSFIAKNVLQKVAEKKSESIFSWAASLLKKKNHNHNHNGRSYDSSTADSDLEMY